MESIEKQEPMMSFEDALVYLAKCQAEYNRLGAIVSTKDPDSLRSAVDEEMRMRYELHGVKSLDVMCDGVTVATYSVAKTKEQPERRMKVLTMPEGSAIRWIMEDAPEECYSELCAVAAKIAEKYMSNTGEIIEGAQMEERVEPAVPSHFKNTVLKINAEGMRKALGEGNGNVLLG